MMPATMKRILWVVLLLAIVGVAAGLKASRTRRERATQELALYGTVDLRQVELSFNNSERVAAILVEEGNRVQCGQVLARLDTSRLEPQVRQAAAQAEAAGQIVKKLHHGSRPEEIAQARANVDSAKAEDANARVQFNRLKGLLSADAAGQIEFDNAKAALEIAEARVIATQKTLELLLAGPRIEEIAEAEARLQASEAQLAFLKQQIADTELLAPTDAIVRSRLMEPGEMASPQRPAFSLAVTDPKWVRTYVAEPDLGRLNPGMVASVAVDSFPGRRFEGWVGFISPVAEFTPKTVQVEELRTSLVYEARVFVKDPTDELRLGMPATVYVPMPPYSRAEESTLPSVASTPRRPSAAGESP
jgi:HlyD family secretion protein